MKRTPILFLVSFVVLIGCDNGSSGRSDGTLAFHTDRDGNFEIYFADPAGGGLERITSNTIPDRNPSLALNAGTLVFTATIESFLQTVILESDTLRNLTSQSIDDRFPSISSDGSLVAFIRNENVYLMNADGSGQINLTGPVPGASHAGPSFSSDGSKIVFSRSLSGGFSDIFVVGVDGSGLTNLTASDEYDDVSPHFSPDDARLAFVRNRHVSVMNADGSEIMDLMPGDTSVYNGHPVFSPDGQRIAFSSDRSGNRDIFVMNGDGTEVVNVTDSPSEDDYPAWKN